MGRWQTPGKLWPFREHCDYRRLEKDYCLVTLSLGHVVNSEGIWGFPIWQLIGVVFTAMPLQIRTFKIKELLALLSPVQKLITSLATKSLTTMSFARKQGKVWSMKGSIKYFSTAYEKEQRKEVWAIGKWVSGKVRSFQNLSIYYKTYQKCDTPG